MLLAMAYSQGKIKIGDYINYNPDYRECILNPEETGYEKRQQIETEDLKYQFAGIIYGKIMLVADSKLKKNIMLQGKMGHKKGPKALERYMQECYSSVELEAKGTCLTEETFEKLPNQLKYRDYKYWLSTPYVYMVSGYVGFGVRVVVSGHVYSSALYLSDGKTGNGDYSVRPAVIIPSDIQIDENNNLIYEK